MLPLSLLSVSFLKLFWVAIKVSCSLIIVTVLRFYVEDVYRVSFIKPVSYGQYRLVQKLDVAHLAAAGKLFNRRGH